MRGSGTVNFANTIILNGGHYFDNTGYHGRAIVMVRNEPCKLWTCILRPSHISDRKTRKMMAGPISATGVPVPSTTTGRH